MRIRKRPPAQIVAIIILILLSTIMVFPFFWLVRSSFMTDREIMTMPIQWLPSAFNFDNYRTALTSAPFLLFFRNTGIIAVGTVAGQVLVSSFIAFGFARLTFPGRDIWFGLLLSTLMIPFTVVMIPQFIGWQAVGGFDTFWPLIAPSWFGHAFNVFLIRQFYYGIPKEYDEAALVDGANYFKIYRKIILPMSKPALCAVGVFTFMAAWNDFLGPLLYLSSPSRHTVSLGLQVFIGQFSAQLNLLMAASMMSVLPMIVIFFFAQRYFIEGITFSGLKG